MSEKLLNRPVQVGNLELKNRLVMPPMRTGKSNVGHVTEDLVEYYRIRAEQNEFGLLITEHQYIVDTGRASADQLSIAEDEMIAELKPLTDAVHRAGSCIFAQLNHAGNSAVPAENGEVVSSGNVRSLMKKDWPAPRPLTIKEIGELEDMYAAAAARAVAAGYDGVEIHSAHGYLLDQFYSPITNNRDDAYGAQTMENRLRFLMETIEKVRDAVGSSVPVAVRLGGADYLPGGATEEDAVEACRRIENAGVDLLDLSGGMCFYMRPGHTEPGYFGSMTAKVKKAVTIPVILTGGVKTPADAEQLLLEEKADLIGIGRAVLQDANWRKNARN